MTFSKKIKFFVCSLILLVSIQCGGNTSSDSNTITPTANTNTPTALQASQGESLLSQLENINTQLINSDTTLPSSLIKAIRKSATTDNSITESFSCDREGTQSANITLVDSITDETNNTTEIIFGIDLSFDDCANTVKTTLTDASTCSLSSTLNGSLSGNVTMIFDSDDTILSETGSLSTSSACEGLTLTLQDQSSTMGVSLDIDTDSSGLVLTGNLCVDSVEINIEDIDLNTFQASELECE